MSLDQAALVEPLSIGLYAVRRSEMARDARIAVLGAGPIGLSVLLSAKALAPCTACVTDLLDERLEIARRLGADWTVNARSEDTLSAIRHRCPKGLDLVFECSGDPACIDQAQSVLVPGGTLMIVGIPPTDQLAFEPHRMRRSELTFKSVRRQNGCVAPAIELVHQGRINVDPFVTHHFRLAEIREAFELVAGYRDGVVKAIVELG